MSGRSPTPRENVERACALYGRDVVVARIVALVRGEGVDPGFVRDLVGLSARPVLSGAAGGPHGYWPRVWGMRALLYAYDSSADPAIAAGTRDESWRVREMAAKVTRQHAVHDLLDDMLRLRDDDVARVRTAADRALRALSA